MGRCNRAAFGLERCLLGLTLVIGDKRWSSWSLRPWLALKQAGIPFEERCIALRQPDTKSRILDYSPAGKVPVLLDGEDRVWGSLAILDYLAARFPEAGLWPRERSAYALALSISAEMHSGFPAVRAELGMNVIQNVSTPDLSDAAKAECRRIQDMWRDARERFGGAGPFLFGRFSNADAMYAPVATRFQTYNIELESVCRDYVDAILALPAMAEWYRAAGEEES
jgi:glutathione S-transferase